MNIRAGGPSVLPSILSVAYVSRGTKIAAGLQFVSSHSFLVENGARAGAKKVTILMTDEKSTDDFGLIAPTVKSEGVVIICVGIEIGIDTDQLNAIAYNTAYVVQDSEVDVVINIKNIIQISSCGLSVNDRR
ncbi:Collagen alpha-1(XII) chain [Mizuhopecten yessoensis]|uniref:Collagen alpha-1(XII) chain n=1 Tax=Mizuhopecten yessoensis TaxID=6573 RepID=A0A210PVQ6_MIZYE|nr:Collagen alpha-1(XII) chain [Mizuhopecten yessoensis]